jgi:hypothetical protein
MEETLHIPDPPIRVSMNEWLFAHEGRYSAARKTNGGYPGIFRQPGRFFTDTAHGKYSGRLYHS